MTLNEIFFGLITAAIITLVVFLIRFIVSAGETVRTANKVLERADQNLRDAVTEANESLRSLRVITDNIGAVTSDISSFSRSIRDTGEEIRRLTGCVNNLGNAVQSVGTEAAASIRGVRAGFKTGFEVLLKDLFR